TRLLPSTLIPYTTLFRSILLHQVRRQRIDLVPLPRECSNNTLRGRFWRDLSSCNRNVRRTRNASRQRQEAFRKILRHQSSPPRLGDLVLQLGEFDLPLLLLRREIPLSLLQCEVQRIRCRKLQLWSRDSFLPLPAGSHEPLEESLASRRNRTRPCRIEVRAHPRILDQRVVQF